MTFITHGFQVSVVSDVQERVQDFRITSDARAFMAVPVSYYNFVIIYYKYA
jgi:hypothetical protein